ncbi:MAG: sulfide/dihydroorotate dehydrogenase-like FAD/NAD-binding protein [Bacteroidetes bacterium]|nr:sulfide/dihydroorotate dehydrogenase-like FAD/NAD-binding protein [Bacteroidota bacterium]
MFKIREKEFLSPTIARFVIEAPFIAPKRKPGNFVILRVSERGERIPITLVDSDPGAGTVTLIVQGIGKTTKELLTKNVGDAIPDVVGPLGKPTPIHTNETIVCVGGGVGTAELLPITRALHAAGNIVYSIVGARSRDLIILEQEMAAASDELFMTTDDGSYGRKGFVTDQLRDLLTSRKVDTVYAIGPLPMMKAVSGVTKDAGVKTVVSLNALMVDGTGMCGGCRVSVGGKMRFACVDGPEFNAHEVDFDELIIRNRSYSEHERESVQRFEESHACQARGAEVAP